MNYNAGGDDALDRLEVSKEERLDTDDDRLLDLVSEPLVFLEFLS